MNRIGQIPIVQEKPHTVDVRIAVEVINPARVESRRAPDDAMDFVALGKK